MFCKIIATHRDTERSMCDRQEEAKNTMVILNFDLCCPCVNALTLETGYMKTKQNSLSTVLNKLNYERRKSKEPLSRTGQARQNLSYKYLLVWLVMTCSRNTNNRFEGRITKFKKCTLSPENPTHSNNLTMIGGRRDKT